MGSVFDCVANNFLIHAFELQRYDSIGMLYQYPIVVILYVMHFRLMWLSLY